MPTLRTLRSDPLSGVDYLTSEFQTSDNPFYAEVDEDSAAVLPDPVSSVSSHPKKKKANSKAAKAKSTASRTKTEKPTMTSVLGSPVRILKGAGNNGTKDHEEFYDVDLSNEEMHGEYLVTLCTDELITKKDGSTCHASSIVVARPNSKPADTKLLKATVSTDSIEIVGPAKSSTYLGSSKEWLGLLEKNKKRFSASKLGTTLTALVTKMQKKKANTKTTILSVKDLGIKLSNQYFNDGCQDGALKMVPLPYSYEANVGKTTFKVTEAMVIWRAYIESSEDEVSNQAGTGSEDYDLLVHLLENINTGDSTSSGDSMDTDSVDGSKDDSSGGEDATNGGSTDLVLPALPKSDNDDEDEGPYYDYDQESVKSDDDKDNDKNKDVSSDEYLNNAMEKAKTAARTKKAKEVLARLHDQKRQRGEDVTWVEDKMADVNSFVRDFQHELDRLLLKEGEENTMEVENGTKKRGKEDVEGPNFDDDDDL
ncbi:hypothetical protein SEMRO_610_G175160.1 [Seminavis robusta]|uniref:Uncharacterized protein n=1 Tax=Seminavis robusta TaxID=568900 RepID=A0A9N8E3D5_9STRA|nr:hypothetical protein SEMRO_610_G175160.1 [Seminavis robusta]|eukprot:Sro610_g175160.1 n/a (481) ;mRNA; r:37014-38963